MIGGLHVIEQTPNSRALGILCANACDSESPVLSLNTDINDCVATNVDRYSFFNVNS